MFEQEIENFISKFLTEINKKNALEFITYLGKNDMLFEKAGGYWKDKLYWYIKYNNKYVCYILIGSEEKPGPGPWIVWSDDSGSNCYKDLCLDEHMKETFWKNIDFCGNCGGCSVKGTRKMIFGKEYDNICRTTFKFIDPDIEALECMKKMVEIRKEDILRNI